MLSYCLSLLQVLTWGGEKDGALNQSHYSPKFILPVNVVHQPWKLEKYTMLVF